MQALHQPHPGTLCPALCDPGAGSDWQGQPTAACQGHTAAGAAAAIQRVIHIQCASPQVSDGLQSIL